MRYRTSNFLTAAQVRARDKRMAAASAAPGPHVSYDALLGIVNRECDKLNRRWYGVDSAMAVIEEIRAADPVTRKEARAMMLAKIDQFPVRS